MKIKGYILYHKLTDYNNKGIVNFYTHRTDGSSYDYFEAEIDVNAHKITDSKVYGMIKIQKL